MNNKISYRFKTTSLANNQIIWVTLPTFDLRPDQQKEFDAILKQLQHTHKKKAIIFDLRGNQGGNSEYGSRILEALFGKQFVALKNCLAGQRVYVDWRVSPGNLAHISYLSNLYKSPWLKQVEEGLKHSVAQNSHYYREHSSATCGSENDFSQIHRPETQIAAVIDSSNVSAALDFIDELKLLDPNIKLIGQTTDADRLYMEVRRMSLPSGKGDFYFPIKVYRNRQRSDNQPYTPDIEYNDISNTKALQEFIIKYIGNFDQ